MLYVTTRNHKDPCTAPRTLTNDYGPDGGAFAPFYLSKFEHDELLELKELSFGAVVAKVLNLFYNNAIKASDVDFGIGRLPVKCVGVGHRVVIAELWRNTAQSYAFIEKQLYHKLNPSNSEPTIWARTAIRIAVFFGVYSQILASGQIQYDQQIDICVDANNQIDIIACIYCRKMGLPVSNVICGCGDSDALWQLLHQGEIDTRELGIIEKNVIESLVHSVHGTVEVQRFLDAVCNNGLYTLSSDALANLQSGMFAAVVSGKRASSMIRSIYHSNGYMIGLKTVAPFGALQDFRAKTGESRTALICVNALPLADLNEIADAIDMPIEQIRTIISSC